MAPSIGRRSRPFEADSDEESTRQSTPTSTARNDTKRARRSYVQTNGADTSSDEEDQPQSTRQPTQAWPSAQTSMRAEPSINSDAQPDLRSRHKPGAIVRIKLTNFVTYTSAEFFPGPNLNMVIGPNGTGKSTLVCAICLGLGWGAQYLGRAKDAAEFVKTGCREAAIEIELQRWTDGPLSQRRNIIVTRIIKKEGNKSTFLLNGSTSTAKGIQTMAQEQFNIQIDNLCQFLPQDKVVEFAQMTPIEILHHTQRAIAGPEMLQKHDELKRLRSAYKSLAHANRGDREHLTSLEHRQEMQRTEVERLRERAVVQKKLEWIEKCRPVAQFREAREKNTEAKKRYKQLERDWNELRDREAPALRRVNAKQEYEQQVRQTKAEKEKNVQTNERKCSAIEKEIGELSSGIQDCDNRDSSERSSVLPKKQKKAKVMKDLTNLRNRKQNGPPDFDITELKTKIAEEGKQMREKEYRQTQIDVQVRELNTQAKARQRTMEELHTRLEGFNTQSGRQESKLESLSRDTFKAWRWIQDNKDQFEQPVYGPPIVECSLKDSRMADMVESLFQPSDFKIITVQNERDFALLQQKLNRELNLHDVSLRTCSLQHLDQFKPPLSADDTAQYGLDSWAIHELEGPTTVLAMLCIEKNLHQCGISKKDVSQAQHEQLASSSIRSYVANGKSYQFIRRAEYGAAGNIARVRDVRPARWWTNQPVDMGRKARIERELAERKGELLVINEEFTKCKDEKQTLATTIKELQDNLNRFKAQKDDRQKLMADWNGLDTRIKNLEQDLDNIDEFLSGFRDRVISIQAEKDQFLLRKAEAILKYAAATHLLREGIESLISAELMHIEAVSDFEVLRDRNLEASRMMTRIQIEKEVAKKARDETSQRARELMVQCQKVKEESEKLVEDGESGFSEFLHTFAETYPTLHDLEVELDSQRAQLELTEGGNANAIKEFEERARQISKLQARFVEFDTKQIQTKELIAEIRAEWEPHLDALIAKISDNFSDSFARIGCAGQVSVFKASSEDAVDCTEEHGGSENGLDFANWAIHVRVKFRENEPLSLLDSHRQSGGERAVSTIFYLMALQSLSRAPFRVVDEINQGMDPRNERMVHGRMVDIAADNDGKEEGGSQYFLITPKLLSGLKYRKGMTVLCIVSGEHMPGPKMEREGHMIPTPKVNFRAFAQRARELRLNADAHGEVESGFGNTLDPSGRVAEVGA